MNNTAVNVNEVIALLEGDEAALALGLVMKGYKVENNKNNIVFHFGSGSLVCGKTIDVALRRFHSYDSTQYYAVVNIKTWSYDGDDVEIENHFDFRCQCSKALDKIEMVLSI